MEIGRETGSVVNYLMTQVTQEPLVTPEAGLGVTLCMWTDRKAGTILTISPSGKTITIQEDIATRIDTNGMSESQHYNYQPNLNGTIYTARLTKMGWRVTHYGYGVVFGIRKAYHDYSF